MLLFALAHAIEILGEAANRVSPQAQAAAPQVPWAAIVAMRNRLIHGYFDISTTIVWNTPRRGLGEMGDFQPGGDLGPDRIGQQPGHWGIMDKG